MKNDKFRLKLLKMAMTKNIDYPKASIKFFGASPTRSSKAIVRIYASAKSSSEYEFHSQGNCLSRDSHFNKEVYFLLKSNNVSTLKYNNLSQSCHEEMESDQCFYWKNLSNLNQFGFTRLTAHKLCYELGSGESRLDEYQLCVYKPSGVGGNILKEYEIGMDEDNEIKIDSPIIFARYFNRMWVYGVDTSWTPGPGPDEWSRSNASIEVMIDDIVAYYFSPDSVMKKIPIYDLCAVLSRVSLEK